MSDAPASPDKKPSADFHLVEDPKEAISLLKEATTTISSTMLWTKNQEKVVETHLSLISEVDRILYTWIPPDLGQKDFVEQLAKSGTKDCYFSVSAPKANLFFKATFLGIDEAGFKYSFPEKVFKVQRRKDFRFQIPVGHVLRAEFDDPLGTEKLRPKILDISAGGISLIVSDAEEVIFSMGMVIKDVVFTVKNRKITVDCEVRHKRAMPESSRQVGHKIGLQYVGIKSGDAQHIAGYVNEESRKYLSRFI